MGYPHSKNGVGISQEERTFQEVGVAGSWWWHSGGGRTWNGGLWDVLELLYIPVTEFGPGGFDITNRGARLSNRYQV